MIRTIRNLCICLVCVAVIVSTGLSMWVFVNNDGMSGPVELGGNSITIEGNSSDFGTLTFVSPTESGFENYTISVQPCTTASKNDLYADVFFAPSIKFTFSDYEHLESESSLFYYVTFTSTSPIFAEGGYLSFDTSEQGQSSSSLIELPIRDENDDLIFKKDANDQPILGLDGLPIYEITESFSPIFKYRSGKKPKNILDYRSLVSLLNTSVGESVLTLHIVSQ